MMTMAMETLCHCHRYIQEKIQRQHTERFPFLQELSFYKKDHYAICGLHWQSGFLSFPHNEGKQLPNVTKITVSSALPLGDKL